MLWVKRKLGKLASHGGSLALAHIMGGVASFRSLLESTGYAVRARLLTGLDNSAP